MRKSGRRTNPASSTARPSLASRRRARTRTVRGASNRFSSVSSGRAALAGVRLVIPGEESDDPAAQEIQAGLGDEAKGREAEDADRALLLEGPGQELDAGPGQAAEDRQVLALQALEPAELGQGQDHVLLAEGETGQQGLAPGQPQLLGGRGVRDRGTCRGRGGRPTASGPRRGRAHRTSTGRSVRTRTNGAFFRPGDGVVQEPGGHGAAEEERSRRGAPVRALPAGNRGRRRTRALSSAVLLRVRRRDEAHAAQGRIAGDEGDTNGVPQVERLPAPLRPEPPARGPGLVIAAERREGQEPGDEIVVELDEEPGLDDVDDDARRTRRRAGP